MLPEILKAATDNQGLLKEIYGDLAKPGVQQVGKALSTVLGLGNTVLIPITLLNAKGEATVQKNLNKYREQVKTIPIEEVQEVTPEIGVPILEKLSYVSDETVSQLFINLLSKASSSTLASQAHPSFVNKISNLSPDEATMLHFMQGKKDLPFIDIIVEVGSDGSHKLVSSLRTDIEKKVQLRFPLNLPAYLSNLESLGVIEIAREKFLTDETLYQTLNKNNKLKIINLAEGEEINFKKGIIEITPFGEMFINSCTQTL